MFKEELSLRVTNKALGLINVAVTKEAQQKLLLQSSEKFSNKNFVLDELDGIHLSFSIGSHSYIGAVIGINNYNCTITIENNLPVTTGEISNAYFLLNNRTISSLLSGRIITSKRMQGTTTVDIKFDAPTQEASTKKGFFPTCSDYPITATAEHPFLYDERFSFSATAISNSELRVKTRNRRLPLLPEMFLPSLELTFPGIGTISISVKIKEIISNGSKNLEIVLALTERNLKYEMYASKYCISQNTEKSLSTLLNNLRKAGFSTKRIKDCLNYRLIDNEKDYEEVLKVRYEAYNRAGKISGYTSYKEMADCFDKYSKIIVAKLGDYVIGSVRLTLPKDNAEKFELDDSINLPQKFRDNKTVEISRLCVAGTFQRTDAVLGLLERCAEYLTKMGAKYVISSCTQNMLPFYNKIAFKSCGITFELKTLGGLKHHLIFANVCSAWRGQYMHPIAWISTYSRISNFLQRMGYIRKSNLNLVGKLTLCYLFIRSKLLSNSPKLQHLIAR